MTDATTTDVGARHALPDRVEGPGYTLYLGDALEILPMLEAGSVGAVVCDPPYEANLNPKVTAWDVFPSPAVWEAMGKAITHKGALSWMASPTKGWRHVGMVESCTAKPLKESICWITKSGRPVDGTRPKRHWEQVWIHSKSGRFAGGQNLMQFQSASKTGRKERSRSQGIMRVPHVRRGAWEKGLTHHPSNVAMEADGDNPDSYSRVFAVKRVNNKKPNRHPTEKPVDLMAYLIGLTSPAGAKVLDPFMGSGTTGEAALRTGRRFIGIEQDPHWFDAAAKRLAETAAEIEAGQ